MGDLGVGAGAVGWIDWRWPWGRPMGSVVFQSQLSSAEPKLEVCMWVEFMCELCVVTETLRSWIQEVGMRLNLRLGNEVEFRKWRLGIKCLLLWDEHRIRAYLPVRLGMSGNPRGETGMTVSSCCHNDTHQEKLYLFNVFWICLIKNVQKMFFTVKTFTEVC